MSWGINILHVAARYLCRVMILWLLCGGIVSAAPPRVVVSIAPIHSLVSMVMQGVAEPTLLIGRNQSPHAASITPSMYRQLFNAELVIWLGPSYETNLRKLVSGLSDSISIIHILKSSEIVALPNRVSSLTDTRHDQTLDNNTEHSIDPHLWLSFDNALAIIKLVRDALVNLDSGNIKLYQHNAATAIEKINQLRTRISASLVPFKDKQYLIYHDAFQYFEHEFELNFVRAVTSQPDRKLGLKSVLSLKQQIASQEIECIFHERQYDPKLLRHLAEQANLAVGLLDPIGAQLKTGPNQWFELIELNKNALIGCGKP